MTAVSVKLAPSLSLYTSWLWEVEIPWWSKGRETLGTSEPLHLIKQGVVQEFFQLRFFSYKSVPVLSVRPARKQCLWHQPRQHVRALGTIHTIHSDFSLRKPLWCVRVSSQIIKYHFTSLTISSLFCTETDIWNRDHFFLWQTLTEQVHRDNEQSCPIYLGWGGGGGGERQTSGAFRGKGQEAAGE